MAVTVARLLLLLPFRLVRPALGHRAVDEAVSTEEIPDLVRQCAVAVRRATERVPFEVVCLPQAMALQWMLRRRGRPATVVFGLARVEGWRNHAWLEHDGRVVLGAQDGTAYTPTVGYRGAPLRWSDRRAPRTSAGSG